MITVMTRLLPTLLLCLFGVNTLIYAESQTSDYKGISDPFGDPTNYEFAEDEKEDKEFFHLGRYLMLGLNGGVGAFTGGLGSTVEPGPYAGLRIVYFFDRSLAFEASGAYGKHNEVLAGATSTYAEVDTSLVPITFGFRYYFDTRNAPRSIAVANPYLLLTPGLYLLNESVISGNLQPGSSSNFGAAFGGGVEFLIYRRHIYLGLDFRYHLVFFVNEATTLTFPPDGQFDRSGDYFSASIGLTYNY